MYRAILLLLSLLSVSGCESAGGNSLAAFGPNTIPPAVRQPGTDPYYTAASAAPSQPRSTAPNAVAVNSAASNSTASTSTAASTSVAGPPASAGTSAPATIASTTSLNPTTRAATIPSNEPPVRIIESGSSLPSTVRPADETSRLPATPTTSPSPLQRTSVTPKLQPIPSSAFGGKSKSSTVVPASYEQADPPVSNLNSQWRQR